MGSIGAMMERAGASRDRYGQHQVHDAAKLVAEGVEAQTPYRGSHGEHDQSARWRPPIGDGIRWRGGHPRAADEGSIRSCFPCQRR